MAEFVSNSECEHQSSVLVDVTGAMRLAHPGHLCQTQSTTRLVHPRTDVMSEQAHTQITNPKYKYTNKTPACKDNNNRVIYVNNRLWAEFGRLFVGEDMRGKIDLCWGKTNCLELS